MSWEPKDHLTPQQRRVILDLVAASMVNAAAAELKAHNIPGDGWAAAMVAAIVRMVDSGDVVTGANFRSALKMALEITEPK